MKGNWLGNARTIPLRCMALAAMLAFAGGPAQGPAGAPGIDARTTPPPYGSTFAGSRAQAFPDIPDPDHRAARFLTQATFGPKLEEIAHLRQIGGNPAWIAEQMALPASYELDYLDALGLPEVEELGQGARMEAWFLHALGGPDPLDGSVHRDQLRQRVAFALSEIFVVSDRNGTLYGQPYALAGYYDVLVRNAFGNYRQLLEEVTLHPAMGIYLSTLGNQKPNPELNIRPDENYAREVLQLFSVGLVVLNQDGTPRLDIFGRTMPTYDQFTVRGFAHVFTGWTFDGCEPGSFPWCWYYEIDEPAWRTPMQAHPDYHASAESKQLLQYPGVSLPDGLLPGGGTPQSDLDAALDNIFNHPNIGPFIGRQLIQRLVTSNPSRAYVGRVAAAFNDNGQGVRGDLGAVVKAILLDPEARHPSPSPHAGKVREPLLRLTHLWRATDARTQTGRMSEYWPEYYLAQAPLRAPSVFNFFSPDYAPTGELTQLGLVTPELQLATDNMLAQTNNAFGDEVFWYYIGNPDVGPDDISVDLARDSALAGDPAALVDRYNTLFLSGSMSQDMRQVMIDYLAATPNDNNGRDRVQEALYLILNSPEYTVQK